MLARSALHVRSNTPTCPSCQARKVPNVTQFTHTKASTSTTPAIPVSRVPGLMPDPFQALRPDHRSTAFGGCRLLSIPGRSTLTARAPLSQCHPRAVLAVRCKHPVEAGEVDPRFGYQGHQSGDEIERLEDDVRGAVTIDAKRTKFSACRRQGLL